MGPSDSVTNSTPPTSSDSISAAHNESAEASEVTPTKPPRAAALRPFFVLALLFLFLVGIQGLSTGIKGLGKGTIDSFMTAVTNPGIGLVTGILATTLLQSSSVTTSLIVGMVASGALPFELAIPMVMGANIGTTVTNTIAALAQMGRKTEFQRAFAAATCHDFFNYLAVLVLLPLEIATGFLAKSAAFINSLLPAAGGLTYKSPFKTALKSCVKGLEAAIGTMTSNKTVVSVLLIIIAVVIIFTALTLIVRVMKGLVLSRMEGVINRFLGKGFTGGATAILLGVVLTVSVQSSSITTSIMVPLAGAGLVQLWQVFPVTVGANIGTTVTALLATMAVTGPSVQWARQIALVHLLFNIAGTLLFYVPRQTRRLPMMAAEWLASVAVKSRRWALVYVVVAFYGLPALLVFLSR